MMDETQQYLRTIRYRRRAISIFLTAVFGLIVALGVLAIAKINELQGRFSAQNTSKGFSICLHQYHDDYKCFPMAAELENGKSPKHSWRALIEPYFKQFGEFPIAYNKKVAWDAEDNLQAQKYHHSNISSFRYLAVTGPNTVINSERPVHFKEITDDTSNTLMAIAIRKTGPYFYEPVDVQISPDGEIRYKEKPFDTKQAMYLIMADGAVRYTKGSLEKQTFLKMASINGGETIEFD